MMVQTLKDKIRMCPLLLTSLKTRNGFHPKIETRSLLTILP